MRFGVLGPLEVRTDDGTPVTVPELKVRVLLADLLSHDGRPVAVDRLVEDLWGATPPSDPRAVLRTKVSQLRRALDRAEPGRRDLVVWQAPGYALRVEADAVDARRFDVLVARARASADVGARAALLADALALWRGEAFADFAGEVFLRGTSTRLEEQRLTALEDLAEAELRLGRHQHLVGELADQVSRHPLRERLRASYMRALYLAGRQSEALDTYRDLRERLTGELGLDPSPDLVGIQQAILVQDPALAAPTTPARTNLPIPLTELIGRDGDRARLDTLVRANRVVTLTGPGGVGKTRLAFAVAAGMTLGDGVWVVDLAALDHPARTDSRPTPADVAALVAASLGMADATVPGAQGRPVPIVDRLVDAVRQRRMLLVLDNCEHVVAPTAELAVRLLTSAPELRILATSREPLGISGELLRVVAPLDVPPAGASQDQIARADAARLFVARASAAGGFTLDADNAEAVATICRQLDGLPLALELAAARVRSLGVREVARRLDIRLLTSGRRDAPARQQTLRAVIDWSWELLTGPERTVLCRLAVHPDGCTLDAAEALFATDRSAADVLGMLVDRSLVVVAGNRYRLAGTVAAYSVERLAEAGELDDVRRRRDDYYVALAERADARLRGPEQRQWLARLDAETVNLRGVLDAAVARPDGALVRRLAIALAWYWVLRGRLEEAHRTFTSARAFGEEPRVSVWCAAFATMIGVDTAVRDEAVDDPMLRWVLATSLYGVGELSTSERLAGDALAAFRDRGDGWGTAAASNTLAWHALARGDHAIGVWHAQRSLDLFRSAGDEWGQMLAVESLAAAAEATGRYPRAVALYERSLRIGEQLGLGADIPFKLCGLADVYLATGDYREAEQVYERARLLAAEQSIRLAETYALIGLGRVARRTDRLDTAEAHLGTVLEWRRRNGYEPQVAAVALTELGLVAQHRGQAGAALAFNQQACHAAHAGGDPRTIAQALEGLAGALALADRHTAAARLSGTAAAARTSGGTPLPPADRPSVDETTTALRNALGHDGYTTVFDLGAQQYPTGEWISTIPHPPSPSPGQP